MKTDILGHNTFVFALTKLKVLSKSGRGQRLRQVHDVRVNPALVDVAVVVDGMAVGRRHAQTQAVGHRRHACVPRAAAEPRVENDLPAFSTRCVRQNTNTSTIRPPLHLKEGFPYSLSSVGPRADPGVQTVSPQVT